MAMAGKLACSQEVKKFRTGMPIQTMTHVGYGLLLCCQLNQALKVCCMKSRLQVGVNVHLQVADIGALTNPNSNNL